VISVKRRKLQGLCKLPSDAVVKARDDTAAQVNRILLTFVGTFVFYVLSLLTPDSALLASGEKLNVPLAGPVSFDGFMLLGPAVLIVLRVYLQIYAEHQGRLDRIAQLIPAARSSLLTPDENPLLRMFRGLAFYLLLPLAMLAFWWKAAVFPKWGLAFAIVAAAVIAMHLTLLFHRLSWNRRAVITLGVTILAMAVTLSFGISVRRPFNLFRANLADQWLPKIDLKDANLYATKLTGAVLGAANLTGAVLGAANLTGADLGAANLTDGELLEANLAGADLTRADLTRADLTGADLTGANLTRADLPGTHLTDAKLIGANLTGANLDGANGLAQEQLDTACGDAQTALRAGLSVKFCSQD
jgi:pentapeptide repeat protein